MEPDEHEQLQSDIPDLAADRLQGEARNRLRAHVAGCADCSRLLDTAREIGSVVRWAGRGLLAPHPGVEELRRYAQQGGRDASEAMEAHARFCAACGLEIAAWNQTTDAAERHRWGRPRAAMAGAALLAAGVLLGLLLGSRRSPPTNLPSPATSPPPTPPIAQVVPWSGPVDALRLEDAVRGTEGMPEVRVREGQPLIPLIVALEPLERRSTLGIVEIRIVNDEGRSVWTSTIDAALARDVGEGVLELTFLAPSAALPPGAYEARVRRAAATSTEPLLLAQRFRVRR